MKSNVKKNIANTNNGLQSRRDTQSETNQQPGVQPKAPEAGTQSGEKPGAASRPRQSAQSGRKSRDNFGSYKGY